MNYKEVLDALKINASRSWDNDNPSLEFGNLARQVSEQNLASKKFLYDVQYLVNFYFKDEEKHYNELIKNEQGKFVKDKNHIFKKFRYVKNFLRKHLT